MNSTKTHYKLNHGNKNYIYTPTLGYCKLCENNVMSLVITHGNTHKPSKNSDYDNWESQCVLHLNNMCCKKQHCNNCNKKSVIKDEPKMCKDCLQTMMNSYIGMTENCKFPDISRQECKQKGCTYCKAADS